MPSKLARAGITNPRVILVDPNPVAGATMGEPGRPVVNQALSAPGVESRLGVKLAVVDATRITLMSGEFIPAQTVVWCAGTQASPLTASLAGERNRLGRLPEP